MGRFQPYFDRQGQPMTMEEFAAKLMDYEYKVVRKDHFDNRNTEVSTVWLGMNHQFGEGPPLIFETMIFSDDEEINTQCWRYPTEAAALAGHDQVCAMLRDRVAHE